MRVELKIENGKEPGRVRYTYPKPTSHRNIQCSRQTEAWAHCCRQAPYSCILKTLAWRITTGLCWEPTNRSSNLRRLRRVQLGDVLRALSREILYTANWARKSSQPSFCPSLSNWSPMDGAALSPFSSSGCREQERTTLCRLPPCGFTEIFF